MIDEQDIEAQAEVMPEETKANPADALPVGPVIESDADVDYWLKRTESKKALLQILEDNYKRSRQSLEGELLRDRRWCGNTIRAYCREKLDGIIASIGEKKAGKTLDFQFGRTQFKTRKGGPKVVDEDKAVAHALEIQDVCDLFIESAQITDQQAFVNFISAYTKANFEDDSAAKTFLNAIGIAIKANLDIDGYLSLYKPESVDEETGEVVPEFVPPGVDIVKDEEEFYFGGKRWDTPGPDELVIDPDSGDCFDDPAVAAA